MEEGSPTPGDIYRRAASSRATRIEDISTPSVGGVTPLGCDSISRDPNAAAVRRDADSITHERQTFIGDGDFAKSIGDACIESDADEHISDELPISPLRPVNLDLDPDVDVNNEDDVDIPAPNGPSGRKRGRRGLSFRISSSDDTSLYEKAFILASQRTSGQIFEPIVGTEFDSETDAHKYYTAYSWEMGFGIRLGKKYVNSSGYKTSQIINCSCQGHAPTGVQSSVRKVCNAMVRLKRTYDDGWYFEAMNTVHNNELADTVGEKRHWKCHNLIDPALKNLIKNLRDNNIPLSRVYGVMCDFHGGSSNLPFRKRALRSTCLAVSREASHDDINKLMGLFSEAQLDNRDFYYRVDSDEDGRVQSIFWTHAKSQADYICFGDAITFDTTYKCNLYEMPVGLFVGVNNHSQCCLLGCVILRHETAEAFKWAFRTFVTAMKGKHPGTILTDMCRQMELAISAELPNTVHRWCKWHVLKKARENLGVLYKKGSVFKTEFDVLLNFMMTESEFEQGWSHIIGKYNLGTNTFLKQAYDCRLKWAKPYFKGIFCAMMTSTQRNECMNHALKTYVNRAAPLNRFFSQYIKFMAERWGEEDAAQAETKQVVKVLWSGVPIERHAYKVYTHKMFDYFADQLFKSGSYTVELSEGTGKYVVEHIDAERRAGWCQIKYGMDVDIDNEEYNCECGLFDHTGMLCCHVLKVMVHRGLRKIPSKYILKRWTRDTRDVMPEDIRCYQKDSETNTSKTYRSHVLYRKALELVKLGDQSMETFTVAVRNFEKVKKELIGMEGGADDKVPGAESTNGTARCSTQEDAAVQENIINDTEIPSEGHAGVRQVQHRFLIPETRPSRGRPPTKRMRGRGERPKNSDVVRCQICESEYHELSSCPTLEVSDQMSDPEEPEFADPAPNECDGTEVAGDEEHEDASQLDRDQTMNPKGASKPVSAPRRCKLCGEVGHYRPSCPLNDEERAPVKSPVCKKCGIAGHMSNTCGRDSSYKKRGRRV